MYMCIYTHISIYLYPGSNTPQNDSSTVTYLPSHKPFISNEQDMLGTTKSDRR